MICPRCSNDNIASAVYCNQCGFQLEHHLCPECETANPESARFCNHCGCRLVEDEDAREEDSLANQPLSDQPGKPDSTRNKGPFVVLFAIIIILSTVVPIGIGIFNGVQSWTETFAPTDVVKTYCSDLLKKDAAGAYQQFSSHLQQGIPESTLATNIEAGLYPKEGGLKKCDVPKLVVNHHTRAVAFMDLTTGNGKVTQTVINLVLENGTWKIDEPGGLGTEIS